jgi:hypothetical protein
MAKRIQKVMVVIAAVAAMALGGAVFAQAHTTGAQRAPAHAVVRHADRSGDRDNVQSGDQSAPDRPGAATADASAGAENPEQSVDAPESAFNGDGPGGHADAPGANVDHQFQGNE